MKDYFQNGPLATHEAQFLIHSKTNQWKRTWLFLKGSLFCSCALPRALVVKLYIQIFRLDCDGAASMCPSMASPPTQPRACGPNAAPGSCAPEFNQDRSSARAGATSGKVPAAQAASEPGRARSSSAFRGGAAESSAGDVSKGP